jgi:hypothetical protein
MAYRADSPLSRPDVRDRVIQAAQDFSARGDRLPALVADINQWPGVDGVTAGALKSAWKRWRWADPSLPMLLQLFPGGGYRNKHIGTTLDSLLDEDDLAVAEERLAAIRAGRSHTIPAERVYAKLGIDVDVSEWDRDDKTEPGAPVFVSGEIDRPVQAATSIKPLRAGTREQRRL